MVIDYSISNIQKPRLATDRIIPKGRYFSFLGEDNVHLGTKDQYIASRQIGSQLFLEIKCTQDQSWHLALRDTPETFWMAFQFLGSSSIENKENPTLTHQQYLGFFNTDDDIPYHLKAGKTWTVLIGMELENLKQLSQEWPTLAYDRNTSHLLPALKIASRNKKILEQIQRIKDTPFSLSYKLNYQVIQLMETYHGDLLQHRKSLQKEDVSLFHRAKAYIVDHYTDEDIDIKHMASELLSSERTLYRIFHENGLTVNSAIQVIRIYKGREMLRRTNKSVDMIAFHLQFSTAKYFIKQYVRYFGHTPAVERKMMPQWPLEEDEDEGIDE